MSQISGKRVGKTSLLDEGHTYYVSKTVKLGPNITPANTMIIQQEE